MQVLEKDKKNQQRLYLVLGLATFVDCLVVIASFSRGSVPLWLIVCPICSAARRFELALHKVPVPFVKWLCLYRTTFVQTRESVYFFLDFLPPHSQNKYILPADLDKFWKASQIDEKTFTRCAMDDVFRASDGCRDRLWPDCRTKLFLHCLFRENPQITNSAIVDRHRVLVKWLDFV